MVRTLAALLLALSPLLARAAVEFDINPDPAILNESCRLTFRVTGEVDGEPDFTPLEATFDIIGRNRQTAISWINGRREETTSWVLSAMPRAAGRVTIPAIRFGQQESLARALEIVGGAAAGAPADASADIVLQVEATPAQPYVQQQVIYTVRLLHRIELSGPRFSALTTSSDAIVKPLGNGRQYVEKVDGRSFDAFEQRYAIFPQKSGSLTINPLVLTTQVVTGTRSFFDPFSQSLTTRRVESKAVTLEVRPVPAAFPAGAAWLPARRLRLHEEWEPDANTTIAGTPLARTLFLWADGLIAGQLPSLTLAAPAGVKLYPDQAQSNEQDTASGFTAVLQQKFAIIATANGDTRFAAVDIPWWNTETDSMETAHLPERALGVSGATSPAPPPPAATVADTVPAGTAVAPPPAATRTAPASWRTVAVVCALGWALTLIVWGIGAGRRRHSRTTGASAIDAPHAATARRALRELEAACQRDDAPAAREALLAWALARAAGGKASRSLGELADELGGAAGEAIRHLDRRLYGRPDAAWRGVELWSAVSALPREGPSPRRDQSDTLPPLFKLVAK